MLVFFSKSKDRLIERPKHSLGFFVCGRPFDEIKSLIDDIGIHERGHDNPFFNQINQVILEEVRINIAVLILHDIIDH